MYEVIPRTLCQDTGQPGHVFRRLGTCHPEVLLQHFHGITCFIFVRIVHLCLVILCDFRYYFGFVAEEMFSIEHTIKSCCLTIYSGGDILS